MNRVLYRKILFFIIILFIAFDGIRSNVIYNQYISPLKELCIFLIFIEAFSIKGDKKRKLPISLIIITGYIILMGIVSLTDSNYVPRTQILLVSYKFSQLAMLSYSFYFYQELTYNTYKKALRLLIKCCCIYTFINIFSLIFNIPIWERTDMWFGRLSRGYPTTDTIVLAFSLTSMLFLKLDYNPKVKVLIVLTLIVSLFMQNTGSGLILIPVIIFFFVFRTLFRKKIVSTFRIILAITFICLASVFAISVFKEREPLLYNTMTMVFQSKVDNFIKGQESESDFKTNSIEARQDEYKKGIGFIRNESDRIFGIGTSRFTMNTDYLNSNTFTIESMFFLFIICYGIIGIALFSLLFIELLIKTKKIKDLTDNKIFYFLSIFIFCVASSALTTLYFIQTFGIIAITIALIYKKSNYEYSSLL